MSLKHEKARSILMAQPQPTPQRPKTQDNPLHKGLLTVKQEIDKLLEKMQREAHYTPERPLLDKFSARALELIQKYHPKIAPSQKALLMAVIDLTEIPVMHPKMQRVAYQTALRDASKNLASYLAKPE